MDDARRCPAPPSGRVDLVVPDRDPGVLVRQTPGAGVATARSSTDWLSLRGPSLTRSSSHAPTGRARRRPFVAYPSADGVTRRGAGRRPARQPAPSRGRGRSSTSGSRSATASSCRRTSGCRPPPDDAPDERFPAILEMIPYRKDDWRAASDEGRGEWLAARGFAFCRLDVRGTGSSRRRRARRVHRPRDAGRLRGRRVAGRAAVVQRQRRHVGDQLRRLHRDPGREAPPAAPAGDRADDGDRRPLHRRRPLPRRLRDGVGAEPVRGQHGRDERAAAVAGVPRRRAGSTSGASGSSGRRSGSSSGSASSTTGRTGGRARSPPTTDAIDDADLLDRRLDGRVRRRRAADAGALHERAAPDARRQLGPRATRTTRTRARTSTGTTSWSASSTTG